MLKVWSKMENIIGIIVVLKIQLHIHNYFVNAIFRSMGPLSIKSREQENETR